MKTTRPDSAWSLVVVGALLVLTVSSCREENSNPQPGPSPDSVQLTPGARPAHVPVADTAPMVSANPESLLIEILPLRDSVEHSPKAARLRQMLVQASFDSTSGSFIVVGKGVRNATAAAETARAGQKRAALIDAKRWGLYLRAWQQGDLRGFGEPIGGTVAYTRVLLEQSVQDTLLQLVQIPQGSIEVP